MTKAWKYFTRDNSTFRECSPLRIRSSFKRFPHCGSKVLGVVQSSKCFVLKWKTACGFSTCVVRIFLYHDFAYVKSVIKISKGYKKWNCFSKTGLNTSLIVSIVIRTATSVTEMISLKCKFHVLKGKMLICLSHQNLFLARHNAKSHGFFNLTILGVCENSIFLFRTV